MNNPSPLEVIFFAALEKGSPRERAAYLDGACAGDAALRRRVEKMLAAQSRAHSFLEQPAAALGATVDLPPVAEGSGTVIGPYKLIEQIGEGGMGTVWMARQTAPVKRVVAVKLIKAGMDSKQVIARFEAERQALALMDHPNIARVLDAGTTGAGRPYFVMDLVKGVPITRYCDERHLTPRQQLTDKTLVTGFGAIVGTLEYMSPEQAEINQLDIDTRSDIYSLGVLLYELLAGSPPFTRKELERV